MFESFAVGGATQGTLRTASAVGGAFTPKIIKRVVGGNPNAEVFAQTQSEKLDDMVKSDLANNLQSNGT